MDEILVVEGGAGDGGACQKNRVEAGRGGQHTRTAHSHLNAAESRLLDFRRILERNGPAREFIGGAHQIALCKTVHLNDRTIHIKIQFGTVLSDLLDLGNGIFHVVNNVVAWRDGQAKALQIIEAFGVGRQLLAADLLHIEHKDGETAASCDLRVFLAQRTCRRIAGVFKRRGSLQLLLGAEMLERLVRHIHLTPHFQKCGGVLQMFWDLFDGPNIGGDILADNAIATGGSTHQLAVFVFQAAGKAVDLDLHHILRLDTGFLYTAVKIPQFIVGERIQQTLHFNSVGHLGKASAGRTADMLRGRCRRDQFRVGCFQFLQLPGQGIVLKIFQLGRILIVIKTVVLLDDRAQLLHTLPGLFQIQHLIIPHTLVFLLSIPHFSTQRERK